MLGGDRSDRLRLIRKEQSDRLSFMIGRLSRGVETSVHCFLKTGVSWMQEGRRIIKLNTKTADSKTASEKLPKPIRYSFILKELSENPYRQFRLQYFADKWNTSKSTISEDLAEIERYLQTAREGKLLTTAGAAGGVMFQPYFGPEDLQRLKEELCRRLQDTDRIIVGDLLYMNDLFYDPNLLEKMSKGILSYYDLSTIDYVATIETKGIPLATRIAGLANKPLVIIRKRTVLTEGTSLYKNYTDSSSGQIKTLTVSLKAVHRGSRVLFVDDFMRAGGTANAVKDLLKELDTELAGIAVVMVTGTPRQRAIDNYQALVEYDGVRDGKIRITPR